MSVSKRKILGILSVAVLFAIAIYGTYQATHKVEIQEREPMQQEVTVIKPRAQNITVIHNYIGQVDAINKTEIVPYISGYVTDIAAQGGQDVKKGEVLATLKQDDYIAELTAAEAAVYAQKAEFLNARIKYERMLESGEDVYSAQELDDAKSTFMAAAGNLEKARANQFAAETKLDYTYIKAPFDGVLGNVAMSLGEYISPQSNNLMELVQYNPIRVVFSITDKDLLNHFSDEDVQTMVVKVQLADGTILPQTGVIKYTDNQIDANTNSLAVYSEFDNPDNKLMPNAYVEVLLEREYKNTVLVAKPYVIMKPDGDYVYTILNGVANLHKIHIWGEVDNHFAIEDNFDKNEYIVEDSIENIVVGESVTYKVINKAE